MIVFHPHPDPCYRCEATAWEAIDTRMVRERGRSVPHDVVECCFCGVMVLAEAAPRPVAAEPQANRPEFRFQFGRFEGMTFAEADGETNGRAYLEHLRDTNEKLRDRIAEYLTAATA